MIDLRSDTVTRPTPAMYQAMCEAPLGDDAIGDGDDPTVHRLQDLAAGMFEMESALFVPTGMMGNLLAARLFVRPGARVICEPRSHLYKMSVLALAGANPILLPGDRFGAIELGRLQEAMGPGSYDEKPAMLCLENSFNGAGGTALSVEYIAQAAHIAHQKGVPVHLDGARIFNAAMALGADVREFSCHVDTLMFCLSKGLSSPVGSLLLGPRELIRQARGLRSIHGGSMRQAGILAACGIVSLETMLQRLPEDHQNARLIAEGLAGLPGVRLDLDLVQTNLVWLEITATGLTAQAFAHRLEQRGVLVLPIGSHTVRIATHKDITTANAHSALTVMQEILA